MLKRTWLVAALVFALLVNAFGRQQQPPPASDQSAEDEVVRITTNLVQVDAVVTDKDGKQVTGLTADDFEILEDNRPQKVTNFTYVRTANPVNAAAATTAPARPSRERDGVVPPPPTTLRPEQVQRTIALVVDDLMMSAESIGYARQAIKKYVDEQVQPGDLVAIIRTSAGEGLLQQFTNDRQKLYAAASRVRWLPRSTGGQTSVPRINTLDMHAEAQGSSEESAATTLPDQVNQQRFGIRELNEFRRELFVVGTLGTLNFVVRGLKELPGRKAVVLFSDGMSLRDSTGESARYMRILEQLVDQANRASVVFYTIDAKGVQPIFPGAADDTAGSPAGAGGGVSGMGGGGIRPHQVGQRILRPRSDSIFEGQSGLRHLARETGGQALINSNDLNRGIRRALDDMSGYYLIGYRPDEETFDPATGRRKFHRLSVRVKHRPDLTVRSRSGFLGFAEEEATRTQQPRTRGEQLMSALITPFGSGGVNLRLTSLFINTEEAGSAMRSMLLIDPRTLTFTKQPDGQYQTVMDIMAVTFGDGAEVVDQLNRIETIRVRPEAFERFLREGMVYDLNVPVKRPGAYQLRIAVRDTATQRTGSASQYVEVPNLKQNRLALSGLVLASATDASSAQTPKVSAGGEGADASDVLQAGPASRRFRKGSMLDYGLVVYNARPERATGRPRLTVQTRLYRDGKLVFSGQPQPIDPGQQAQPERVEASGRLQLGAGLPPGEYVLQVIVTDALAERKHSVATQWVDFELVN